MRYRIAAVDLADLLGRVQKILGTLLLAIPNVVFGLVVFGLFWLIGWLIGKLVRALLARAGQPRGVRIVLGRLVTWVVLAIGLSVAATVVFPALNAATLFGALGFSSVAIGFAFKDIFQNLLAGLLILLTRPFRIGDQIVTGIHEGIVEDILVRATLLRTYDGRRVVIPNSELYTNRVVVDTAYPSRRLSVTVGVGPDEDLDAAKTVVLGVLSGAEVVLDQPPPQVLIVELGDYSVVLDARFWVAPSTRKEVVESTDVVLGAIKTALDRAGIGVPYPTQQIVISPRPAPDHSDSQRAFEVPLDSDGRST